MTWLRVGLSASGARCSAVRSERRVAPPGIFGAFRSPPNGPRLTTRSLHPYSVPQDVAMALPTIGRLFVSFGPVRAQPLHDPANELRRTPLPRTPVNRRPSQSLTKTVAGRVSKVDNRMPPRRRAPGWRRGAGDPLRTWQVLGVNRQRTLAGVGLISFGPNPTANPAGAEEGGLRCPRPRAFRTARRAVPSTCSGGPSGRPGSG